MSEMIERVAKALYEMWPHRMRSYDLASDKLIHLPWDKADRWMRDICVMEARTAIAAMREPTEALK